MPGRVLGIVIATIGLACAFCNDARAQDLQALLDAPVLPRSGLPCPPQESFSLSRPDPPGTPTVVGLAMMIQDISRFSDVDQTMTLDAYLMMRWHDPRLADPRRGAGSADCPVPEKTLWMPAIEPEDLRSRQLFYPAHFLVDANGMVTYARRLLIEVANPLDLHDFPFDHHSFRISLWPTVSRADEVVFRPLRDTLPISSELSIQGWTIETPTASAGESERLGRIGKYYRYDVDIGMTREWRAYALKLGVPLFLIVLMAYSVYYIPPAYVPQQVAVGMTSMLTLIAYMLALGSSLPKIAYLTRADVLFVGCAVLVFFGLLKAIMTTIWLQKDNKAALARVDRIGRWSYPAALLLVVAIALK